MRKLLLLLLAVGFTVGQLQAQTTRVLSGKITGPDGSPIPNTSITVKNSSYGTTSKADGTYTMSVPASSKVLVISAVGMAEVEVSIGNKEVINISLEPNDKSLAEVVVVGYGTQQKKAFTGSASRVDVKEFSNLMTPSVDKLLAGRAAGVQVTNPSGLVNAPARIRIRGINSLTQSVDPLIVVDGVPIISGNLALATNSNTLGDINPNDIESMEVLKDGSATAIYGSRAAAGVILITTKKGAKGKTKVAYDGFVGFSSALKKFNLLNAKEFELINNEKFTNAGKVAAAGTNASVDTADTDWQKEIMIKNAPVYSHSVSVQGGSEKTLFYLSLNYSDQKGIIISNYNKAYRVRLNLEHEINKFVKIGNNATFSRQEDGDQNNGSNTLGGAIAAALRQLPNVSPYSATHFTGYNISYPNSGAMSLGPNAQTVDDNFNNIAFTLRNNKYYSDKYRIIDNAFLEISPVRGLKIRSQFGVDMLNDYSYQGLSPYHGDGYGTPTGGTNGSMYNAAQNYLRYVITNYFNYNLSFNNHNFFLTGGHEVQKQKYKWFSATGTNISDIFFIKDNYISGSASIQSIGGSYDVTSFESVFGRINYDFNSKYFAQASIRRDGQSALAPGKKYGTFPGFSIGWRPSQEKFYQNLGLDRYVNEFKIKGSYAKVGNTLGGYPYLSTFGAGNYGNISGIAPTVIGNPELQWETSTKYDVGVELGVLDNRFNITADWFLNDVDNLVYAVPTPPSAGIPGNSITKNIATLKNKGIELSLSGNIMHLNDFAWDFNVNYSQVKNKVTSLYEVGGTQVPYVESGSYNLIRTGDPIYIIYGYNYAGVNSANGNPMYYKADGSLVQLSLTPGSTVGNYYVASKDNGTLGAQSSLAQADKVNLGQGVPTWFGAFSNSFNYKGIGLDVMFRYSGGNKIMNVTRQDALFNQSFQNNGNEILGRWTTPGQITDIPKLYYGQGNNINLSSSANSRFVEKGDYLRLQNVVLSYSVNNGSLQKWTNGYVKTARVYAQGQNLHVWSKYKGADPDNISALGVDAAVSPQVRTISFGLSLGF